MKKIIFILSIMSSIIAQSCQKKLYPEGAYLDNYFFIRNVGIRFMNEKGRIFQSFSTADAGHVKISISIGSFVTERGWKMNTYLNLYGKSSSITFFHETDEICSSEYSTRYIDNWVDVGTGQYTYLSYPVVFFENELSFSLFSNDYDSALLIVQFFKNNDLFMTLTSSGYIEFNDGVVTSFKLSNLKKGESPN